MKRNDVGFAQEGVERDGARTAQHPTALQKSRSRDDDRHIRLGGPAFFEQQGNIQHHQRPGPMLAQKTLPGMIDGWMHNMLQRPEFVWLAKNGSP